jgi:hypothetical protein
MKATTSSFSGRFPRHGLSAHRRWESVRAKNRADDFFVQRVSLAKAGGALSRGILFLKKAPQANHKTQVRKRILHPVSFKYNLGNLQEDFNKVGSQSMCTKYRESLMALMDNELSTTEKIRVEEHMLHCTACRTEFDSLTQLNDLTSHIIKTQSQSVDWDSYYRGVCRKMDSKASWMAWSVGSLLLVISGSLMLFGLGNRPLAMLIGAMAIAAGIGTLWLSYFCSCTGGRASAKHSTSILDDDLFA